MREIAGRCERSLSSTGSCLSPFRSQARTSSTAAVRTCVQGGAGGEGALRWPAHRQSEERRVETPPPESSCFPHLPRLEQRTDGEEASRKCLGTVFRIQSSARTASGRQVHLRGAWRAARLSASASRPSRGARRARACGPPMGRSRAASRTPSARSASRSSSAGCLGHVSRAGEEAADGGLGGGDGRDGRHPHLRARVVLHHPEQLT